MNYIYITKNTSQDLETMHGYSGTTLLHTDPAFLVWLWANPVATDLQATQGVTPSVNLVAMAIINVI